MTRDELLKKLAMTKFCAVPTVQSMDMGLECKHLSNLVKKGITMKLVTFLTKSLCIVLCLVTLILGSINCAYASKEELLDLEEEKSDIEDRIEERRARGQSYEDLEERRNDVQDEIDNVQDDEKA